MRRIKDKIRNRAVPAEGPSDSLDRCAKVKKEKPKSLTLVFQVHSFGKHKIGKIFYFPLDPTLDRFSDPMLDSKPDKWPQREEIKVSFLFSPSQQFDSQSDMKEHMADPVCCWSQ